MTEAEVALAIIVVVWPIALIGFLLQAYPAAQVIAAGQKLKHYRKIKLVAEAVALFLVFATMAVLSTLLPVDGYK